MEFVNFEDALQKLNISADQLNELRENNLLRAYRDGSSWKFRSDDIERMSNEGVPELPPPSDISLIDPADLVDAEPLPDLNFDDDLGLADLPEIDLGEPTASHEPDDSALDLRLADDTASTGSELELAGLEDTVTAGTSDLSLDAPDEPSDPTDSILLSEEELGESVTGSLSTIIGRKELDLPDADLELELDNVTDEEDTKLSAAGASDVLSSAVAGSGVLDEMEDISDAKKAFKDLEELELDLAAESSLALNPADVADAREKASQSLTSPKGDSDLKLGDDEEPEDEGNMGSTDVPLEDLAAVGTNLEEADDDVELELAGDDDLILADAGGSDITLDSGDSGINLISPSDSGLALDDIPLDVGGSAILSSLSLEGSDPEISLLGSDVGAAASGAALQTDDDFQLTPLSEGGLDDGDSSSQVIALDADLGSFDGEGAGLLEEGFSADDEGVVFAGEFGEAPAGDLGMAAYTGAVAVPVGPEAQFGLGSVLLLIASVLFLGFGVIMMFDMLLNVWSWNGNYAVNSSMLDAILGLFGLR